MVILVGEAMAGSSITAVDSRTRRVQTVVEEDFFLQMQAPFTIEVFGLAMVKDTSLGASSSSTLNAELELNLDFVIEVSPDDSLIFDCYNMENLLNYPDLSSKPKLHPSFLPWLLLR